MAFINEYISESDKEKYALEEINKRFVVGGTHARDWTVDHDRDMYLRNVAMGREDFSHQSTWTFYWRGQLIIVELENICTVGEMGGRCHGHKRVHSIEIPACFETWQTEILADLKEAFVAYKDGGVFASASQYTLTLDV
jgi:hypothetical protein